MSAPNDDAANEAGGGGESTPSGGSGDSVNYDDVIDQTEEEEKARECNLLQSGVGNDKLIASGLIHGDEETGDSQIKEEVEENSRRIEDAHIQEYEIHDASPPESAAASAQDSSYDDDRTKVVGGEAGCDNDHRIDVHDHRYSNKSSNRYQDATYDKNLEECFPEETHSMEKLIAGDRDRPNAKLPSRRNRRLKAYFALGLVLIAVIATVVVVVTTMKLKEKYSSKEVFYVTPAPKESPTMAPKERDISGVTEFLEKNVLIGNKAYDGFQVGLVNGTIGNVTTGEDNFTAWNNLEGATTFADLEAGDPRLIALEWILHKDAKQLEVYDENLSQRYILGLLAVAWDSESWDHCGAVVRNTTEVEVADTDWSEDSGTCITSDNATDSVQTYQRWLSDAHECDWYGVACKDGNVLSIKLAQNNLIGEIVPELGMLRSLQIIDLSSNCIYGTLPSSIGQLSILNILDLKDNGLGGNIPEEFFNLTNLVKLDLSYNANNSDNCTRSDGTEQQRPLSFGFEGNILESNIGRLQLLLDIDLTDNYFSGSISPQIGKLKQLGRLVIDNNVFNSFIPDEITQLINLKELWLSLNYFTGGIPENIGALKSLESFSMWGNEDLTGQIPDSLYNLTMLEDLHLFRNSFSGSISEQIGRLTKLKMLTLAENNFTGTLPTELGLCHDLEFLRIEMTNIEGSAPKEVCDLTDKNLFSPDRDEEYFKADCLEDNVTKVAFFVCDCCSSCCDHVTNQCIILD